MFAISHRETASGFAYDPSITNTNTNRRMTLFVTDACDRKL